MYITKNLAKNFYINLIKLRGEKDEREIRGSRSRV